MKKTGFFIRFVLMVGTIGIICRGWDSAYKRNREMTEQKLESVSSDDTTAVSDIKTEDVIDNAYSLVSGYAKKSTERFKTFVQNTVENNTIDDGVQRIQGKVTAWEDKELLPNVSDMGSESEKNTFYAENLEVHFIDVGQGDSILLKYEDGAVLIDAGDNEAGQVVADYLSAEGVNALDALFVTHPDADHCGGVDTVMESLDSIDDIYMSECKKDTYTYKEMMECVENNDYSVTYPQKDDIVWLEDDVKISVLSPEYDVMAGYEDANMYSLVLRVEYKENSVLLMGDAPVEVENMMLDNRAVLATDVLKLGHHGSYTSTSDVFLDAVGAESGVVIMAEKGNDYSHPHGVIMDKLESRNLPVYRTDTQGTLKCVMDGDSITWNKTESKDYRDGDEVVY